MTLESQFGLSGRDIWFFGGAGYLGSKAVSLVASAGARVLCVDREGKAQRFVTENGLGKSVDPLTLDVADIAGVEEEVERQLRMRGTPSGLVLMTYSSSGKALADLSANEFDDINHAGLTATFSLARKIGSAMAQEGRGSIVLFSSMYGTIAPDPKIYEAPLAPNPIEYGMGKAAFQQMARYLAVHWGSRNVRCNSIAPGPFPIPSLQQEQASFIKELSKKTPLQRIGRQEEIAGSVLFLLSDASSYVTGHNLAVDGGWTAW